MRTILIVEDEHFSRMVAEAAARELGLVPLAAQSGEEGIALAQARETLKILFTDINMPPGPDRWAVAREVRRIHPDIQVIYTSGQAGPEDCTQFGVPGALLLTKPYTSGELAVAITEAGLKLDVWTLID